MVNNNDGTPMLLHELVSIYCLIISLFLSFVTILLIIGRIILSIILSTLEIFLVILPAFFGVY